MDQHRPAEKKSNDGAWFWISNAANVVSLLIAAYSLLVGSPRLAFLFISIAAVFFFFWLRKRRWKMAGVSLISIATLITLGALTSMSVQALLPSSPFKANGANVSPASTPDASSDQSSPAGPTTDSKTASATTNSKPKPIFSGEITLPRHGAVDVDKPDQPVVAGQSGITSTFDLFHDSGPVMSDAIRTHDGVYTYPVGKSSAAAYDICSDYTSPDPSYNAHNPNSSVRIGSIFCFTTSDHRVAWASVKSVERDTFTAVLEVRVWDKLVGDS